MTCFLLLIALLVPLDTLSLATAYREAEAHYPLRQTMALQDAITDLKLQNLATRFRPDLALNGQASYQSDVPSLTLSVPGASPPQVPHDQYRLSLSVDQLVYDGGLTSQQKALETLQRDLAKQNVRVETYHVREQVNTVYFGVLLQQARLATLHTLDEDLQAQLGLVRTRIREGVALSSNADVLAVERLKVEQQIIEADAQRRAALAVLGTLLGRDLPPDLVLTVPDLPPLPAPDAKRQRPEYARFDLQQDVLAQQAALTARGLHPQVTGFAEAAYGRPPGQDFFQDTFQPFYSAGLRIRWGFWDWNTNRREREALALQEDVVEAQEATFSQQLTAALVQQHETIARLETVLERDDAIIALRERISDEAASRLQNGVITATEYLLERNAQQQAQQTADLHRIQLAQARAVYLTILGVR